MRGHIGLSLLGASPVQKHEQETDPAPNRAERRARQRHEKSRERRYSRSSARYHREQEKKDR